jgi:hypothetical protein
VCHHDRLPALPVVLAEGDRLLAPPPRHVVDGVVGVAALAVGADPLGVREVDLGDDRVALDGPAPSQRVAECPPAYLRM